MFYVFFVVLLIAGFYLEKLNWTTAAWAVLFLCAGTLACRLFKADQFVSMLPPFAMDVFLVFKLDLQSIHIQPPSIP
jgi:hypothetical protein